MLVKVAAAIAVNNINSQSTINNKIRNIKSTAEGQIVKLQIMYVLYV